METGQTERPVKNYVLSRHIAQTTGVEGSEKVACAFCGELCWLSPATKKRVVEETEKKKEGWGVCCMGCIPKMRAKAASEGDNEFELANLKPHQKQEILEELIRRRMTGRR